MTVRPCVICGTPTTGHWCSTSCHQADEPGAYDHDDWYDEDYEADRAADRYERDVLGRDFREL